MDYSLIILWLRPSCISDEDECSLGTAGCSDAGFCVNTDGGYNCTCPVGNMLDNDGKTCLRESWVYFLSLWPSLSLFAFLSLSLFLYALIGLLISMSMFACNRGWNGHLFRVGTESLLWRRKFSPTAPAGIQTLNLFSVTSLPIYPLSYSGSLLHMLIENGRVSVHVRGCGLNQAGQRHWEWCAGVDAWSVVLTPRLTFPVSFVFCKDKQQWSEKRGNTCTLHCVSSVIGLAGWRWDFRSFHLMILSYCFSLEDFRNSLLVNCLLLFFFF